MSNFQPIEVVSRGGVTQLYVAENLNCIFLAPQGLLYIEIMRVTHVKHGDDISM